MHPRDTPNYDVLKARENLGGKFLSCEEQQACKTSLQNAICAN